MQILLHVPVTASFTLCGISSLENLEYLLNRGDLPHELLNSQDEVIEHSANLAIRNRNNYTPYERSLFHFHQNFELAEFLRPTDQQAKQSTKKKKKPAKQCPRPSLS